MDSGPNEAAEITTDHTNFPFIAFHRNCQKLCYWQTNWYGFYKRGNVRIFSILPRADASISCPLSLLNANGCQLSQSLVLRQREVPHSQNYATTLPKIAIHLILWVTQLYKMPVICLCQFSSVQSLSHVWLLVTPWTAACQASLSITNSWSLLNSCPLSQWCFPTIWSSVVLFSSCPQSFQVSGSFRMSKFFRSDGQSLEFQLQHQSFQRPLRTDLL